MRILTLLLAAGTFVTLASLTKIKKLTVTSPAFANNGVIPVKYTCVGQSASPPLNITNIPPETKSLAIVVCDPDAITRITTYVESKNVAKKTKGNHKKVAAVKYPHTVDACTPDGFTHWLVWNIDTGMSIPENYRHDDVGMNSANLQGYTAMCPPTGMHHYIFKVYALDTKLKIDRTTDRAGLERVIKGHILAEGQIIGTYDKAYQ